MTQEGLKKLLNYNPETGLFSWIVPPALARRVKAGQLAGYVHSTGYRIITMGQKRYKAHRLAWLYVHGTMPRELDHRNGIRSDNRIVNLRLANRSQNNGNRKSGQLKGATFQAGKWMAQITKDGVHFYLGRFTTERDAHEAYMAAARKLFGEFARPL